MAKLKLFRTPIGFHDAYVAAPSQKAALEAWGADSNLFAQGIAEVVSDPALCEEALARPGEVIRKARGSAEEHVRALGDAPRRRVREDAGREEEEQGRSPRPSRPSGRGSRASPAKRAPARVKRPSRAEVEKAEAALAGAEDAHRAAIAALRAEQEALERRRRELEQSYREQWDALSARLEKAREEYRRAMTQWAE
ncbi:MAG TPA: hypothetical protein VM265_06090 [Sphingomicrobium sp.]|nr:hypothetical protein [Sphingomicrobium sp.]